jgi:hypothetical protein
VYMHADLFQPFHYFMVKVVDLIFDTYHAIPNRKVVIELEWKHCTFVGDKSFPTVCTCLKGNVVDLHDYITFL